MWSPTQGVSPVIDYFWKLNIERTSLRKLSHFITCMFLLWIVHNHWALILFMTSLKKCTDFLMHAFVHNGWCLTHRVIILFHVEILINSFFFGAEFRDTWAFVDNRVKDAFDLKKSFQEVILRDSKKCPPFSTSCRNYCPMVYSRSSRRRSRPRTFLIPTPQLSIVSWIFFLGTDHTHPISHSSLPFQIRSKTHHLSPRPSRHPFLRNGTLTHLARSINKYDSKRSFRCRSQYL